MKEDSISSIFVVNKNRQLEGIITIDDATRQIKANRDGIEEIINRDVQTVSPETLIQDLIPLFLNTQYPLVVVDEDNRILGILFKASVLAGIIGEEEADDAAS